jgi:hypothetical protein
MLVTCGFNTHQVLTAKWLTTCQSLAMVRRDIMAAAYALLSWPSAALWLQLVSTFLLFFVLLTADCSEAMHVCCADGSAAVSYTWKMLHATPL